MERQERPEQEVDNALRDLNATTGFTLIFRAQGSLDAQLEVVYPSLQGVKNG